MSFKPQSKGSSGDHQRNGKPPQNLDVSFQPNNEGAQSEYTDISKLNVTNISQINFVNDASSSRVPRFQDIGQNNLQKSQLQKRKDDQRDKGNDYLSRNMVILKNCVEHLDDIKFSEILQTDLLDSEEVLMHLYCSVVCFNAESVFDILVKRNNYFKVNPEWHALFIQPRIFQQLQSFQSSIERRQFDLLVLKASLERDFYFMTDLILDRSRMTKEMIQVLLKDNQKKLLVQLISKPKRPIYIDADKYTIQLKKSQLYDEDIERELHFNDILYAALDNKESSRSIIELIKLMKNEVQSSYFEEPEREFNLKELYKIFIVRRKVKLLRFLFTLHNEFDFTPQLFVESLELEAYDMATLLYKEFFRRLRNSNKENEYIITILISSFNKHNGQIDFKAFLIRSYIEQFILRHAKLFLDTLDSKITQENKQNILVLNLNVVKTSCLLIEILEMLSNRFDQLKVRCQTLRQKIENITKKYMLAVETESEMRYLLLEKDFENRDSLDLITCYRITAFLESKFADNVVKEIWRSPYSTNDSLFTASTNHKLTFDYWNCIKDEEIINRFYKPKDIRQFEAHPLQFTVWRYSAKSRIIIEFFTTLIIAIVMHVTINSILQDAPNITYRMNQYIAIETKLNSFTNQSSPDYIRTLNYYQSYSVWVKQDASKFFSSVVVVGILSIMPIFFAMQHLLDIVYASINKRSIDPYSFLNILDFIIFGTYVANIVITFAINLSGTQTAYPFIQNNEVLATIYTRNYVTIKYISEDALWIVCIIILWIRVFYFLRYNEWMGKFVGLIERLIWDVVLFFIFYIIQLVFFTLLAQLCFRQLTDYNTTSKAFQTLFYASMGQFQFDEFVNADFGEYFGITYMIIFLVCNIGIIMNTFIAIITVLYDSFSEKKNIYQMIETLKIRPQTQADKEYSSLISIPAPFNIIHVLFAPFLLTTKNPQCLNEFLLTITYFPIMLGATFCFILYNVFLVPVCFIKLAFHKLAMIYVYSKSYRASRADKFINFILFMLFGLGILVMNLIVDIGYFIRHLWLKDLLKTKHKTGDQKISKKNLEIITQYFKTKSEKIMPFKEVSTDIRNELDIFDYIQSIINPNAILELASQKMNDLNHEKRQSIKFSKNKKIDHIFVQVKEYKTIKEVMERNSEFIRVYEENQRVKTIDCKTLFIMLSDLQRQKSVLKIEDEDYIFIRRAYNIKSKSNRDKQKNEQNDTDQQNNQQLSAQLDSEGTKDSKRRLKILIKKLLFLNTRRMLEILNYRTGENERRKLLFAMRIDETQLLFSKQKSLYRTGNLGNLEDVEQKVLDMGQTYPKVTNSVQKMKKELNTLLSYLSNLQFSMISEPNKEVKYQQKIGQLIQDLQNVKIDKDDGLRSTGKFSNTFYDKRSDDKFKHIIQDELDLEPIRVYKIADDNFKANTNQRLGNPSPQKDMRKQTESDVPDVDDSD